jgi:glutamate synthase (NADPH/NADH) large chain
VRNSGATVVSEGVGDHALEYMTGGLAVILGRTGRNVGAGMSGGIAYILDLDTSLVNLELVDIDPLTDAELSVVADLVSRHADYTSSAVAQSLLADWADAAVRFSSVIPRDYKRALAATRAAERDGLDVDAAVMAAAMAN